MLEKMKNIIKNNEETLWQNVLFRKCFVLYRKQGKGVAKLGKFKSKLFEK